MTSNSFSDSILATVESVRSGTDRCGDDSFVALVLRIACSLSKHFVRFPFQKIDQCHSISVRIICFRPEREQNICVIENQISALDIGPHTSLCTNCSLYLLNEFLPLSLNCLSVSNSCLPAHQEHVHRQRQVLPNTLGMFIPITDWLPRDTISHMEFYTVLDWQMSTTRLVPKVHSC